jgi:uncharacterized protein (DUF2267 family)
VMAKSTRRTPTPEEREELRRRRHEARASATFKTFVRTLCDGLSLPEEAAVRGATSVLCALEQRLVGNEAHHLESQLPAKLKELLVRCERHEELRARDIGRPEFVAMVAGDLGIAMDQAEAIVRGVFKVLTVMVSAGELEDVLSSLPSDLRELWPPIPEDVSRERGARPERDVPQHEREPEHAQELVDRVLALPFHTQLGLLRTIVPRILGRLEGEACGGFLRDLNDEIERWHRGEPAYDIRASEPHAGVRH